MVTKTFAIDAGTGLIKRALGSAAVTATAYIGTQWDQGAAVVTDAICRIVLEAIDISSTNEVYTFRIVGSNVADRSDGQVLAMAVVGDASTITIETVDSAAGDVIDLRFRTERNDTAFRYIDLHLTLAGTTPSITFGAYTSKELA
jgi:hypothetical protein